MCLVPDLDVRTIPNARGYMHQSESAMLGHSCLCHAVYSYHMDLHQLKGNDMYTTGCQHSLRLRGQAAVYAYTVAVQKNTSHDSRLAPVLHCLTIYTPAHSLVHHGHTHVMVSMHTVYTWHVLHDQDGVLAFAFAFGAMPTQRTFQHNARSNRRKQWHVYWNWALLCADAAGHHEWRQATMNGLLRMCSQHARG